MASIPVPGYNESFRPERTRGLETEAPQALVFHVQNPGEDPMAMIVSAPDVWGPYYTTEELTEAYHQLQEEGEIR
jgi:hypothetical protein